jgi:hypothetical protein
MPMSGERMKVTVRLTCGHTWQEHRPERMADPVEGELRACGHPEHYPQQFPASYELDDTPP